MAVCKSTCLFFLLDIYAFQISANKWNKYLHVFLSNSVYLLYHVSTLVYLSVEVGTKICSTALGKQMFPKGDLRALPSQLPREC